MTQPLPEVVGDIGTLNGAEYLRIQLRFIDRNIRRIERQEALLKGRDQWMYLKAMVEITRRRDGPTHFLIHLTAIRRLLEQFGEVFIPAAAPVATSASAGSRYEDARYEDTYFTEAQKAALRKAVARARELIEQACDSSDGSSDKKIRHLFGTKAAIVRGQLMAVRAELKRLIGESDRLFELFEENLRWAARLPRKTNGRFYLHPTMSPTMAAMGHGDYPNGSIAIKPWTLVALDPGDPSALGCTRLAATLVHECTHILEEPTFDFIYRTGDSVPYLPPELAIVNAAHYEQLILDVADHSEFVAPALPPVDRLELGLRMLRVKVARAWVRSNDVKNNDPGAREVVKEILKVNAANIGEDLFAAWCKELHSACSSLQNLVVGALTLKIGPNKMEYVEEKGWIVYIPPDLKTPALVAKNAVDQLVELIFSRGLSAFQSDDLQRFVVEIENYDRPKAGAHLVWFYQWLGAIKTDHVP